MWNILYYICWTSLPPSLSPHSSLISLSLRPHPLPLFLLLSFLLFSPSYFSSSLIHSVLSPLLGASSLDLSISLLSLIPSFSLPLLSQIPTLSISQIKVDFGMEDEDEGSSQEIQTQDIVFTLSTVEGGEQTKGGVAMQDKPDGITGELVGVARRAALQD